MSFVNINHKYLRKLLREFDEAAQSYGWTSDQGNEEEAKYALEDYQLRKEKVVNYLNKKMPQT